MKDWLFHFNVLFFLLPVIGDSLLGRYRAIIAGILLLTAAFLTYFSAFVMSQFNWTQIPAIIMMCMSQLMALFGLGSIYTNMLPFMIDQMIGATADDISTAVQWCYWTFAIGLLPQYLVCLTIPQLQNNLPVLCIIINFLGSSVILITDCLFHIRLDKNFRSTNPLKTIFQVLRSTMHVKPSTQSVVVH